MMIVPGCHVPAPKAAPQERTPSSVSSRSFALFVVKNSFWFLVLGFRGVMTIVPGCHVPAPKAAPQERTPSSFASRSFAYFAVRNGFKDGFRF